MVEGIFLVEGPHHYRAGCLMTTDLSVCLSLQDCSGSRCFQPDVGGRLAPENGSEQENLNSVVGYKCALETVLKTLFHCINLFR